MEVFSDFLNWSIEFQTTLMINVTREEVAVPVTDPTLGTNCPHYTEHVLVEEEIIARESHAHPLYHNDNSKVYYYLEESTRTKNYLASIKPFQQDKSGKGA